jgi:hypothetical protein
MFSECLCEMLRYIELKRQIVDHQEKNGKRIMKGIERLIREHMTTLSEPGKSSQNITEDLIKIILDDNNFAGLISSILFESGGDLELEAFVVGLKIFLGEKRPLVAQEIFEIGKDIADHIRSTQAELANSLSNNL